MVGRYVLLLALAFYPLACTGYSATPRADLKFYVENQLDVKADTGLNPPVERLAISIPVDHGPDLQEHVETFLERAKKYNSKRASFLHADLEEVECLAMAMYHEARGQGEKGITAVAFVIHNRVKTHLWPDTYCDVIREKAQFSFVSDRIPDTIRNHPISWEAFRHCLSVAVYLLLGDGFDKMKSPVGNAYYFHALRKPNSWAYAKSHVFIKTLGDHHFFGGTK